MDIYICHDIKEKQYFENNSLNPHASGLNPRTNERYWVYLKSDLFNKLNQKEE